jgi:acyl-CoA hydrolase
VTVEAERYRPAGETLKVTEAEVIYVSVDDGGRKVPLCAKS